MLGELSYYYTTSPFFYLNFDLKSILHVGNSLFVSLRFRLYLIVFKQAFTMYLMYKLMRYEKKSVELSVVSAMAYGLSIFFMTFANKSLYE